jgi:Flp pilus assembly CpaF family ATPase
MSSPSTATLEPPVELDGSGLRKASALRVLRMLESAMGLTIAGLLKDPDVIEIRCNADGKIYADWFDGPPAGRVRRLAPDMATQVVCIVADAVDQIVGPAANRYILDAEFPGHTAFASTAICRRWFPDRASTSASARRASFPGRICGRRDHDRGSAPNDRARGHERRNILVVGGTKTGKTTLTNAIIDELKDLHQRVATIEKVLELQVRAKEWHSYRVIEGVHEAAQLVEACLRVAPDRIIVGEVRGAEINSMLEAWGTGHPGGICTLHSDTATPIQALRRVETLIRKSESGALYLSLIADTIHLIVPIQAIEVEPRKADAFRRHIPEVVRVRGFEDGKYGFERAE